MTNLTLRMRADASVLILVDYQQRLMPVIHDSGDVLHRAGFLGRVAAELGVPVIGTAQNPSRLGPNDPVVAEHCTTVVEKMTFGACEGGLDRALADLEAGAGGAPPREVVVAGAEAHVCLLQTALGLLESGRRVWAVADASGSRNPRDRDVAMSRLQHAGATVVTAEMVAFEWLRTARDDAFKKVSRLIKQL